MLLQDWSTLGLSFFLSDDNCRFFGFFFWFPLHAFTRYKTFRQPKTNCFLSLSFSYYIKCGKNLASTSTEETTHTHTLARTGGYQNDTHDLAGNICTYTRLFWVILTGNLHPQAGGGARRGNTLATKRRQGMGGEDCT